ncbi:hypothetical protein IU459_18835 [Nocardia amamiensis]|uniref:Uncharacterized protein n=1 Tax=Nocardia amamiensis TaxID=404578 RepID=A0ABS0CSJ2_9NOCA|nr:hypothetical protein [Nocardia amamiensis]MBF6299581.1 hypothetical protein [Nocardia amamiensis]
MLHGDPGCGQVGQGCARRLDDFLTGFVEIVVKGQVVHSGWQLAQYAWVCTGWRLTAGVVWVLNQICGFGDGQAA